MYNILNNTHNNYCSNCRYIIDSCKCKDIYYETDISSTIIILLIILSYIISSIIIN